MTKPFVTSRVVQWYDTDAAGIAHFSAFFRWMEEAEHDFLRSLGMSVSVRDAHGQVSWPRVSVGCDYRSTVKFEDQVEIAMRVTRLGEKSISYLYELTCDEREIATIRATAVCCRIPPGQPPHSIQIPADMYAKLAEYCNPADNHHPLATS